MANLQEALSWAARGLRIFPMPYGDKRPTTSFPELATSDQTKITQLWRDPVTGSKEFNIGVLMGDGMVLIDIDTKFDKEFKRSAVANFTAAGGHMDTLVVKTASGGLQAYYRLPEGREFANQIGMVPGVDVRCHNGYGIAPGSFSLKSGGLYELFVDKPIADIPPQLLALMKPIKTKKERLNGHSDPNSAIPLYADYLDRTPPAIEGQGGDQHTYNIACMGVIDYGLSVPTVYNLLLEHFNPRCQPPWDGDELWQKVENADSYGVGTMGIRNPETILDGVQFNQPQTAALVQRIIQRAADLNDSLLPSDQIPLTRWLVYNFLTQGVVTMMAGPGGVGKSTFLIALGCHAAVGKDFGPLTFKEPFGSMLYCPEDDRAHISGRAAVICKLAGIDYREVMQKFKVFDQSSPQLVISAMEGKKIIIPNETIRFLSEFKERNPDCKLMMFDPMRKLLRGLNENDNSAMSEVMNNANAIATELDVASLNTHHTPKNYMLRKDFDATNADAASGAGAIVSSARIVVNILPQSPEEAERQGRRDDLFSVTVAKNNHGAKGKPTWWERKLVAAPNGELYPAPVPTDVKDAMVKLHQDYVNTVGDFMVQHNINALSVTQAGAVVTEVYSHTRSSKAVSETLRIVFERGHKMHHYVDPTGMRYTMQLDTSKATQVFTLLPIPGQPPPRMLTLPPMGDDNDA